ncbi:MAG: hypothetical protein KME45_01780 [Stenomitos rutilans HA7619-LM2]|jgi:hypothetical protein|nr:hypothetical protein [Stenomitos rutilans HA7619-LM2]
MVNKKAQIADWQAPFFDRSATPTGLTSHSFLNRRDYADADIIRLAAFIRDNPNPILAFNPDGDVIKTNPAAVRLLKRLHVEPGAILPAEHPHIVAACLTGQQKEHTIEVMVNNHMLSLTYHSLSAFKLVYLYVIELTDYRQAEAELLRIASKTVDMAKQAILQLQAFREALPQPTGLISATPHAEMINLHTTLAEMFVSMDGCVFASASGANPYTR